MKRCSRSYQNHHHQKFQSQLIYEAKQNFLVMENVSETHEEHNTSLKSQKTMQMAEKIYMEIIINDVIEWIFIIMSSLFIRGGGPRLLREAAVGNFPQWAKA
jgi:hypothetical protein